ncbi:MAG: hypothetical protein C4576_09180 [Desulfobacteraceae bacterium]|nr:MAG: hypothetical protein C4576_09180 [Desulfobacteraceae bacterium]
MKRPALVLVLLVFILSACASQKNAQILQSHPYYDTFSKAFSAVCYHNGMDASQFQIGILDTDVVNAWAGHKGVMLSRGFIERNPPEYVLKSVISHELAHIKLEHADKRYATSAGISAVFMVAGMVVPGLGLANYLVNPTITSAFSRSQELEADLMAVTFCTNAGVTREQFIETLQWTAREAGNPKVFALWATHPSIEDRIKNVLGNH